MTDFDIHILNNYSNYLDELEDTKILEGSFGFEGNNYRIGLATVLTIINYLEDRRKNNEIN